VGYTPQRWYDGEGSGTPLTADRLNYMETGIGNASSRLDTVEPAVAGKADAGSVLPRGGTAGQILYKTSSTDYATQWQTPGVTAHTHPQSAIDNLSSDLTTIRNTQSSYASSTDSTLAALATTLFGGSTRTRAPAAYVYLNTDAAYPATTDGVVTGNMTKLADPDNMVTLGSSASAPTEITAPVAGMYMWEYHIQSSATTGVLYARVILNGTNSNSVTSRATTQSAAQQYAGATAEGTSLHLVVTRQMAAGDRVQFHTYATTAGTFKTAWFGGGKATMMGIRYLGPVQAG
jgi:hypothetical protein